MNRGWLVVTSMVIASGVSGLAQQAPPKPPTQTPPKTAAPPKTAPTLAMPPAIEAAFRKSYPNATVRHVSKETEGGKTVYEVESVDAGRRRDINYNPDGSIILYEEELTEADIPAAVAAAIAARYPKATIATRERLHTTKDGSTNYEFGIKGVKGVGEVVLTPEGKWVSPKAR